MTETESSQVQGLESEVQEAEAGEAASATVVATEPPFDLLKADIPSFGALQVARASVYASPQRLAAFRRLVDGLPETGESGRRKGMGYWMLAQYEQAARSLAVHNDDVASFTRARSLMALSRPGEALTLYERLSKAYPKEPRPRGGALEARLERDLAASAADHAALGEALKKDVVNAPHDFAASAEGHYLLARAAELSRDWSTALDEYTEARGLDPTLRANLFRAAHLAERCGLDLMALEIYQTLAQLKPIDANVLINLGVLYEDLGRDQDATACYEILYKTLPTDEQVRLYLEDARHGITMYYDEDLERKEDRLNQILRIPITDFELSVRARNCLNKMDITTLGDLVCRTEQELLAFKNFGETSLNEIKEILHSKGLRLGMSREEAVSSVEQAARRSPAAGDKNDALSLPISELQLSIRARRTVEALGCLTVGDIAKHSAQELVGMPNFGQTSLQELRSKLAERGLKLSGE